MEKQNILIMFKYFLIILIFITSCSIDKRIDKATKKWCQFCEADSLTVYKADTSIVVVPYDSIIYVNETVIDTFIFDGGVKYNKRDTLIPKYIHGTHTETTITNYKFTTKTLKPIIKKEVVNSKFAIFSIGWFIFSFLSIILLFLWYRIFNK